VARVWVTVVVVVIVYGSKVCVAEAKKQAQALLTRASWATPAEDGHADCTDEPMGVDTARLTGLFLGVHGTVVAQAKLMVDVNVPVKKVIVSEARVDVAVDVATAATIDK
jgi:hypothetical protein